MDEAAHKLMFMYRKMGLKRITTTESEIDNISSIVSDNNEEELGKMFFKHHLSLLQSHKLLETIAQSEINCALTPVNGLKLKRNSSVILSKTLESFGAEMFGFT